jgi:hypothetical protein
MARLPDAVEQVLQVQAPFLHAVVRALRDRTFLPELTPLLVEAEGRGWGRMVAAVRQIVDGKRDRAMLVLGLDAEDRAIIEAILAGIENPASLPRLDAQPKAGAAAPGLASMIGAAARGDMQAFVALANMAEQMLKAGGDMARLGGQMRRLIDGERDLARLTKGMGAQGRRLVRDILAALESERPGPGT